jgi:hypothetical protein
VAVLHPSRVDIHAPGTRSQSIRLDADVTHVAMGIVPPKVHVEGYIGGDRFMIANEPHAAVLCMDGGAAVLAWWRVLAPDAQAEALKIADELRRRVPPSAD